MYEFIVYSLCNAQNTHYIIVHAIYNYTNFYIDELSRLNITCIE